MNFKYLQALIMLTKFSIYGIIVQSMFLGTLIASSSNAQSARSVNEVFIDMQISDATLVDAFSQIEKVTNYKFSFDKNDLNHKLRVSLDEKNASVGEILTEISRQSKLAFRQFNNDIDVKKLPKRFDESEIVEVVMQTTTISGRVNSSDNKDGLPGASVMIKGTPRGTVTDLDGNYSIEVSGSEAVLVFSSVGYLSEEVTVGNRTVINIEMTADITALDEIVVVGYGTQKRSDLTGSVASVSAKEVRNLPVRSLNEALQGRVAGVQVTKGNGSPGQNADIIIRGAGSINGMPPLYIVDGVRMGTGNNFNIQDVESIEVLKDASAAAIYGSQAAGGVILVTTKRGSEGDKMKVDFNSFVGVRQPVNLYKLLNRDQYLQARQAMGVNTSGWGEPSQLPDVDWVDELFSNGRDQNYTLSLSGGSKAANFYVSGNYQREDGIRIDNSFERYNFRINSDFHLNKRLKVGQSLFAWKTSLNPTQNSTIPFRSVPTMAVRDPTNPLGGWGKVPAAGYFQGINTVGNELIHHNVDKTSALEGNIYADLEILEGLNFRSTAAGTFINRNETQFREAFDFGNIRNPNANFWKDFKQQENYTVNFVLTYAKEIGAHNFNVMAGYESYRVDRTGVKGEATGFATPVAESFDLNTDVTSQRVSGGVDPLRRLVSQFGRINYSYAGKYLLTANIRRDGSDRFGPANKYGVFPSFSAGWRVTEENFMQSLPFISNLKLRGSYGVLGNDNINQFLYQQVYTSQNPITSLPDGTRIQGYGLDLRMPNSNIKWEEVQQADIALEVGFLEDKLSFTMEWYSRQTKDMIYNVPVPFSAGFRGGSVQTNIGQMSNKGVEITALYRVNVGQFRIQAGGNASFNQNKVLLLDGVGNNPINAGNAGEYLESVVARTDIGHPMSQFWGYIVEGIFQSDAEVAALNLEASEKANANVFYQEQGTGAGDLRFKDVNGDGRITVLDKEFIGNPWPKMIYGFNLSVGWKGFDLAALFQGAQGVDIYNGAKHFTGVMAADFNTTSNVFGASYFDGNGLTDQPRVGVLQPNGSYTLDPNKNYTRISSYFVESGSFLKLQNLQIGYTLPSQLTNSLKISNARVYVMGHNLFTITNYSGLDPEISGGVRERGIDNISTYPRTRLLAVGVELGF